MPRLLTIDNFGGMNQRDSSDALLSKSHQATQDGFRQAPGAATESPYMLNVDYDPQGLRKRLGSALYKSLTSVLVASDEILGGFEFLPANGASRVQFIVSKKTFYTDQAASGTFVQINASTGAAYTHSSDVVKWTVAFADGHVFIGTDGANNEIQTYKYGADLDAEMDNGNTYENAYGAGTAVMTGSWPTGAYLVAAIHERLVFSDGQTLMEYTPMAHTASSGIWDLAGSTGGSYHALGRIKFLATFVPQLRDANEAILYMGTSRGMQMVTGFEQQTDRTLPVENAPEPMNYKCWCKTKNWIAYLTVSKDIAMVQGSTVLTNIGARLKSSDATGFLDGMDIATTETNGFAFYNDTKEQAQFYFCTSTSSLNDSCAVVDMKRGEPAAGMSPVVIEDRVRLIPWSITSPDDNNGFAFIYQSVSGPVGVLGTGFLYRCESGRNDQASIAISAKYRTPIFTAGTPFYLKQWLREHFRMQETGDFPCTVKVYLDRSDEEEFSWTFTQTNPSTLIVGDAVVGDTFGSVGWVRAFHRTDRRAEAIQMEISNENVDEDFVLSSCGNSYEQGTQEVA